MLSDFFKDKFHFDFQLNLNFAEYLQANEDLISKTIEKNFSHILNVLLPVSYYPSFIQENYNTTIALLENHFLDEKINYHDSEGVALSKEMIDILYHILHHSTYHRA